MEYRQCPEKQNANGKATTTWCVLVDSDYQIICAGNASGVVSSTFYFECYDVVNGDGEWVSTRGEGSGSDGSGGSSYARLGSDHATDWGFDTDPDCSAINTFSEPSHKLWSDSNTKPETVH